MANIHKLNFSKAEYFNIPDLLVFIRPLRSCLHRVYRVPTGYTPVKEREISQVLTSLCTRFHNGVWYFDLRDADVAEDVQNIFCLMDVTNVYVALDAEPEYSN